MMKNIKKQKVFSIKQLVGDLCGLAGCGVIVYGMYLLHPLAAIFTAEVFLLVIGSLIGYGESQ